MPALPLFPSVFPVVLTAGRVSFKMGMQRNFCEIHNDTAMLCCVTCRYIRSADGTKREWDS